MVMTFGKKLQELRSRSNLSQDKVGDRIGVEQSQVSEYERQNRAGEESIKLSKALALARVYGVALDWLADPDEPMETPEELDLDRKIRELVRMMGRRRAYARLIKIDDSQAGEHAGPATDRGPAYPVPPPGFRGDSGPGRRPRDKQGGQSSG